MEAGEGSNPRRYRQRRVLLPDGITYQHSVENLLRQGKWTLEIVNRKHLRRASTTSGTIFAVFDRTCPPYNWLRPGLLAEERCTSCNRHYRYFYDPAGQIYKTSLEVDLICKAIDKKAQKEVILLDK